MKLHRIIITNYRQFGKFDLKLTYPDNYADEAKRGKPLEKVCFIGKNGTGKTTLLQTVNSFFQKNNAHKATLLSELHTTIYRGTLTSGYAIIFEDGLGDLYIKGRPSFDIFNKGRYFSDDIFLPVNYAKKQLGADFIEKLFLDFGEDNESKFKLYEMYHTYRSNEGHTNYKNEFDILNSFHQNKEGILVYAPLENLVNEKSKSWNLFAKRNDAAIYNNFPSEIEISYAALKEFWSLIIFQTLQRDKKRAEFETLPENLEKRKIDLINEFDQQQPNFLKLLAEKWNKILADCGLYFDYETAKIPQTLEDRFDAYIKRVKDKHVIEYHQLSTGIRNFIFRLGYLYSLYFERNIQSGIVLFDEPEYSLHPELLREVIGYYTNKTNFPNTQFFFATHNATIASQFEPEERVILEFNDDYEVEPRRGIAPEGDDPNDILLQDFGISNTMTAKGIEKWEEYLTYRKKAQATTVEEEKAEYLSKAMEIAVEYKFGKDAADSKK